MTTRTTTALYDRGWTSQDHPIRYLRSNERNTSAVIVWPDGLTLVTDDPIEDLAGRINEQLL